MTAKESRGRPSKLTPELAERLVGLLAGGATVTVAAAELGVDRRTIQHWRARAWSREPRDESYVELERRLQAARIQAAGRAAAPAPAEGWEAAAARLEAMDPLRWGPVAPPDDAFGGW